MTTSAPVVAADLPTLAELQRRWEIRWLGAAETSPPEVAEQVARCEQTFVLRHGDQLLGVALWMRTDVTLIVDPDVDLVPVYRALLSWLEDQPPAELHVLDRDTDVRQALERRGWRYEQSAFDLLRAVTENWTPDPPRWPVGVTPRPYESALLAELHRMIYDDAGFGDVPGHHRRDLDEWQALFFTERTADPVLAWRDEQLVGAAVGRIFDDGTGWVAQLAVSRTEQGRGTGTAVLLEAFRRYYVQ